MFSLNKKKIIKKKINDINLIDGFSMGSKNKVFKIASETVKDIIVYNSKLINNLVSKKVMTIYNKLIAYLTELILNSDDTDSGSAMREALNQIEKFRLEIKIKYRKYLKKKELEMMSKKLVKMQKIANDRLLEIHNSYVEMLSNKRSR